MTSGGRERLEEELKRLKYDERPAVIKAIAEAREHGDLSENAEYHAARERQSFIEGRVLELEDKISRAEVIDISQQSGATVKFGAKVKLVDEETEDEVIWCEIDPCFAFHPLNSYDLDDGRVIVDICRYDKLFDRDRNGPFRDALPQLERCFQV